VQRSQTAQSLQKRRDRTHGEVEDSKESRRQAEFASAEGAELAICSELADSGDVEDSEESRRQAEFASAESAEFAEPAEFTDYADRRASQRAVAVVPSADSRGLC